MVFAETSNSRARTEQFGYRPAERKSWILSIRTRGGRDVRKPAKFPAEPPVDFPTGFLGIGHYMSHIYAHSQGRYEEHSPPPLENHPQELFGLQADGTFASGLSAHAR